MDPMDVGRKLWSLSRAATEDTPAVGSQARKSPVCVAVSRALLVLLGPRLRGQLAP